MDVVNRERPPHPSEQARSPLQSALERGEQPPYSSEFRKLAEKSKRENEMDNPGYRPP